MKSSIKNDVAAAFPRRTCRWGRKRIRSLAVSLATASVVALAWMLPIVAGTMSAQARTVELNGDSRSLAVTVPLGKSENVHTESAFVDVVVADPDTADVMPLTDHSLSILGKKIGATRVSVYTDGKRLMGVFDVQVAYDTARLASELARRFPHAHMTASPVNGRIMLSGSAPDGITVDKAVTFAKQFGAEVINSVEVTQPQQVLLEVRFVEASRTASRELGLQWNVITKNINATVGTSALLSSTAPFGTFMTQMLKGGVEVDALIQALEERQVARTLAQPNLVALSGDTANFLAGGEFPFPVSATLGTVTVEWKRYGVGLAFTPTVLGNGMINVKIEPEVSQLDPTNVIQVANVSLPSLIVRRASTTIELRDGQSFAMAGLLLNTSNANQQQLPWLGDVPVLGALMRSTQYQKKETDLVIIVTPHVVRPARPGDPLRVPTDEARAGNDADLFLLGKAEVPQGLARRIAGAPRPQSGHVLNIYSGDPHAQ